MTDAAKAVLVAWKLEGRKIISLRRHEVLRKALQNGGISAYLRRRGLNVDDAGVVWSDTNWLYVVDDDANAEVPVMYTARNP